MERSLRQDSCLRSVSRARQNVMGRLRRSVRRRWQRSGNDFVDWWRKHNGNGNGSGSGSGDVSSSSKSSSSNNVYPWCIPLLASTYAAFAAPASAAYVKHNEMKTTNGIYFTHTRTHTHDFSSPRIWVSLLAHSHTPQSPQLSSAQSARLLGKLTSDRRRCSYRCRRRLRRSCSCSCSCTYIPPLYIRVVSVAQVLRLLHNHNVRSVCVYMPPLRLYINISNYIIKLDPWVPICLPY